MNFEKHCWAEIDLDALRHNYRLIDRLAGPAKVCAVLKADAYGHGDVMTAQVLAQEGAEWFAVSSLSEALHLRRAGLEQPILVLGHTDPAQAIVLHRQRIIQTVYSPDYAAALSDAAVAARCTVQVHLKVDTGMGRIGFGALGDEAGAVRQLAACWQLPGLEVCGMFQHFSVADSTEPEDITYTERQHSLFCRVRDALQALGLDTGLTHCCNSAGLVTHPEWGLDLVRAGIILYGIDPSDQVCLPGLRPVLQLKATVSQVKKLHPGESVSYGRAFTAEHTMRVATLCAGYADGYPRLLSGKGLVCLRGKAAPVLGRVCMDQMVVDVSAIPEVHSGDEAVLFGTGGPGDTVCTVAVKTGTIPYEILCGVTRRVPRVYREQNRVVEIADFLTQP